ncbi:MAG: LuxR C-terminal-related transcriptional regulator [Sandaracinaceae bacterium]|nr:LuxR C-terminal-related transcriptional regulator [Sandaracinaceae bacterium]
MTHTKTISDLQDIDATDASNGAPRRPAVAIALFAGIALLVGADVVVDALEGASAAHLAVELAVMGAALAGAAVLLRDLAAARARARELARELIASHRDTERIALDAERYRTEAAELVRGLGEAIDRQLERWQLTEAEKEVAVLLLKGLSHKEVADVRGTSERTARGQARSVYQKAGLESRAALSAFFLEDLLPPRAPS